MERRLFARMRHAALLFCFFAMSALAEPAPISSSDKVYINQASATEIADYLDGIGMAKAEAIVAYRDAHGPFADLQALGEVKGVGDKTLEKNAERLAFDAPQQQDKGAAATVTAAKK